MSQRIPTALKECKPLSDPVRSFGNTLFWSTGLVVFGFLCAGAFAMLAGSSKEDVTGTAIVLAVTGLLCRWRRLAFGSSCANRVGNP